MSLIQNRQSNKQDINTENSLLRNTSQSQECHAIQTEKNTNEDSMRKVLQQHKLKKYNNLNWKTKSTNHATVQEEDVPPKKTGKISLLSYWNINEAKMTKNEKKFKQNINTK